MVNGGGRRKHCRAFDKCILVRVLSNGVSLASPITVHLGVGPIALPYQVEIALTAAPIHTVGSVQDTEDADTPVRTCVVHCCILCAFEDLPGFDWYMG